MLNTCFETAAPLTVNVFICFMVFSPIISIFAGHEIFFHVIIKPSALCQNIPILELPRRQPSQGEIGKTWGWGWGGGWTMKMKVEKSHYRGNHITNRLEQTDWKVDQLKGRRDLKQSRFNSIWNRVQ